MNDAIERIWNELETMPVVSPGFLKKRYSAECQADVYVGLKIPEKTRLLILRLSWKTGAAVSIFPNLRGIRIEKVADEENFVKYIFLNLVLTEPLFADVFSVLAEDIVSSICPLSEEKQIVKRFFNRLNQWQTLFERYKEEGLSSERQRGLYGELYFLRKLISKSNNKLRHLKSWVGPSGAVQDFQYPNLAIEVKTSAGKHHQKFYVSSERQLDDSIIPALFLFHLSLDARQGHGETLPEVVSSIRTLLVDEPDALNIFQHNLLQIGYFDSQKELYMETGYAIRKEYLFKVENDFPRLTEKDIPVGVGDIKYSIDISSCMSYQFSFDELTVLLNQHES